MGWKKAVFFGGAVLVLAACSDSATSPSLRQSSAASSLKAPTGATGTITTTADSTGVTEPGFIIGGICTGIVIRTGTDTEPAPAISSPTTCTAGW